jgi:hypothetical protein
MIFSHLQKNLGPVKNVRDSLSKIKYHTADVLSKAECHFKSYFKFSVFLCMGFFNYFEFS